MTALVATLGFQLPLFLCTCVLGGIAVWGWWRKRVTGALLIAIACGVRVLGHIAYVWQMMRLYDGPRRYRETAMAIGFFETGTGVVTNVLFIVGLALILRRLPARR